MTALRKTLKEFERKRKIKVKCPPLGYRCIYCPVPFFGRCKKLENYLATSSWENADKK